MANTSASLRLLEKHLRAGGDIDFIEWRPRDKDVISDLRPCFAVSLWGPQHGDERRVRAFGAAKNLSAAIRAAVEALT